MKKGYWMVVLHPDSRAVMCMALDIGRFQWTRLPMGTVIASDIFQRKLDEVYANLPGVIGIADDMLIYELPWRNMIEISSGSWKSQEKTTFI